MARLAAVRPELAADAGPYLIALLASADPGVRGPAAIALARMGAVADREVLEALRGDEAEFEFYEDGEVRRFRVNDCTVARMHG